MSYRLIVESGQLIQNNLLIDGGSFTTKNFAEVAGTSSQMVETLIAAEAKSLRRLQLRQGKIFPKLEETAH